MGGDGFEPKQGHESGQQVTSNHRPEDRHPTARLGGRQGGNRAGENRRQSLAGINDAVVVSKNGCDAVVLGCTELPLLVKPDDCPLPTLDSTRLLACKALLTALGPH